ncbi:MAG: hypothetical protein M1282_11800, partial [Chloroflexi bacterium]|nr:hypothetical protein [Chloroflexota bacterium]
RKREVLTSELIRLAHDAGALQEKVWKLLETSYLALEQAKLTMGQDHVEWAALAMNQTVDVQLKFRGVMGVPIPQVESRGAPLEIPTAWALRVRPWMKPAPLLGMF